jgi:hypothetical protein
VSSPTVPPSFSLTTLPHGHITQTEWLEATCLRPNLHKVPDSAIPWQIPDFALDPTKSAVESPRLLPGGQLAVHVDVDVLDFMIRMRSPVSFTPLREWPALTGSRSR